MAEQPEDIGRESRQIQRRGAQQFMHGGSTKLPTIVPERIGYLPEVEQKFGVDRAQWRALIDAVWPSATSVEGVLLALSYCKARGLDPFKRPVHVVPVWSSSLRKMVETVWPGIGELRTTAHRTRQYAGKSRAVFGPMITSTFKNDQKQELKLTHPEWCQTTVTKLVGGKARTFEGEQVWWLETYARESRNSEWPNSMWRKRVNGQIAKCSEAAALRGAFPEEIGNEYIDDEIGPDMHGITPEIAVGRQQEPEIHQPEGRGWGQQYTIAPANGGPDAEPEFEEPDQSEAPRAREAGPPSESEQQDAPEASQERRKYLAAQYQERLRDQHEYRPEHARPPQDADGRGRRTDPQIITDGIREATSVKDLEDVLKLPAAGRLQQRHKQVYAGLLRDAEARKAEIERGQTGQPAQLHDDEREPQQAYDPDTGEVPADDDGLDQGDEPPLRSGGRVVYTMFSAHGEEGDDFSDAERFLDALEQAHEGALGFDQNRLISANEATIGMIVGDNPSMRGRCEALGWRDR